MPPEISQWELYQVLLAFFFWLSVFVGLASLVVIVVECTLIIIEGGRPRCVSRSGQGMLHNRNSATYDLPKGGKS